MATADDVMAVIDHRGLRPHEVAAILDDWLPEDEFEEDFAPSLLDLSPIEKVKRLIDAGVSADRLIKDVYDYGTP